jgi:diguanylate cyclase (GGDEF)-like protein
MYECDGEEKYAAYRPLGFNGWYLVPIVPESIAANEIMSTQIYEYAAIIVVTLAAVLLFLYHLRSSSKTLFELENERDVLRQAEERYNIIEEFTETVMFHGDFKTDNIKFGGIYESIYKRKPMIQHISDLSRPHPYVLEEDMDEYLKLGRDIYMGIASSFSVYRILCADGTVQWHRLEYKILFDKENRPEQIVGKISNIDAHKREIQIMSIAAETDAMTGLLNQTATKRHIRHFLNGAGKDGRHGFMLIDVDNFKAVNDRTGHASGNKTLTAVANEIKSAVRASDIVGRMGGDEFIIFIKNVPSIDFLELKAAEICSALECDNVKHTLDMPKTASIGVSFYDGQGDYDVLFEQADTALYTAKAQGKKQYVFFKK